MAASGKKFMVDSFRDIVITGSYGYGNLGDDMLAFYVLSQVCREVTPDRVAVVTHGGRYLERWFPGVRCMSTEKIFKTSPSSPRRVIFGGGGLFYAFPPANLANLWGFRSSTALALGWQMGWRAWRRSRKYAFCVGVGPLSGVGARLATQVFLGPFEEISVRDLDSKKLLAGLGINTARLVADPSIGLAGTSLTSLVAKTCTVAFVVRSWPFSPEDGQLIDSLIRTARLLSKRGWEAQFVSFAANDEGINQKLRQEGAQLRAWEPEREGIQGFCDYLARFRVIVTMRAHGVFLGSLIGATPIAVEIEPKLALAARACGFEDYVISASSSPEDIATMVQRAGERETKTKNWRSELQLLSMETERLRRWIREG